MVKNQGTKQRGPRILDCLQWESNGQCVKRDTCSSRADMNKRGKLSPSNPSQNSFMRQSERKPSRTRSPRGKCPSGRMSRWPCKDCLKTTCNNSFCKRWHPSERLIYKSEKGYKFGEKCSHAHKIHESCFTSRKHSRPKSFARNDLPQMKPHKGSVQKMQRRSRTSS